MKLAYDKCLRDNKYPLAVYTSFSKYYHLEPFLFKSPNATKIFHTWVLGKILLSCFELIDDIKQLISNLGNEYDFISENTIEEFVAQAEKGTVSSQHDELIRKLTINSIMKIIEYLSIKLKRKRVVILLDDAALSLTPDYMVEFFDIFRSLKTARVSPKASVYPGTTQYGPRFHVGQDAELVSSWIDLEKNGYSEFMDALIDKRSLDVRSNISDDIIEILKYASFGIPRVFLNLLRRFVQDSGKTVQQKFNSIINEQANLIRVEYLSLHQKMPQYKSIIETGFYLFENIVENISKANKELTNEKQILIGIESLSNISFDRMMRFLIEAGLLYDRELVAHGENREYRRYIPHFVFLMQKKAFSEGKRGFDPKGIVEVINSKQCKHPVRRSFSKLLYVSAVESYFREIIRKLILIDMFSSKKCEEHNLTYGAAIIYDPEMLPEAMMEGCSFAGSENIITSLRNFIGITKGDYPSGVIEAMDQFSIVCHLRHCCVHRFGRLGSKNTIALGLEDHKEYLEKPLKISFDSLQNIFLVCNNMVKEMNNFLFEKILVRNVSDGLYKWTWDLRKDKAEFKKLYDLFVSTINPPDQAPSLQDAYSEFKKTFQDQFSKWN